MAGKKQLKPVDVDSPAKPLSVSEASERGDQLAELRAMARVIARHLDNPNTLARDLAALTRRMTEISDRIKTLEEQQAEYVEGAVDDDGVNDRPFRLEAI